MTKVDEPSLPGWDELTTPARPPEGGAGRRRQLNLGNLMVALVYFAMVFWAARQVIQTNLAIHYVALAVLIGLGIAALGLWAAVRMSRFAFLGWIVFVVGYMIVATATISVFSIPSLPILIGAILYLTRRRRSTNQDALLWVLRVASERGMPLEPGVRAFAGQAGGIFRIWANSLADLLRQGVALPDAIDSIPKAVPPSSSFLIRMGAESGRLSEGLREATLARPGGSPTSQGLAGRISYLIWVVLIGQGIVGFVLYFIVPKFEAIFKDFGLELPELTRFVIRSSHFLIDFAWIGLIPALAFLFRVPFALLSSSGSGFPLIDRLFPRRHTILILRGLAVVVESGRPIVPALRSMAEWYPTGWVRKKLHQASLYAEDGVDWTDAFRSYGLLTRADQAVIEAATRAGNLAWALRELADSGERRRAYRLQVGSQLLFVLAILALGAVVFVISVAFFLPLTTMIQRLSS